MTYLRCLQTGFPRTRHRVCRTRSGATRGDKYSPGGGDPTFNKWGGSAARSWGRERFHKLKNVARKRRKQERSSVSSKSFHFGSVARKGYDYFREYRSTSNLWQFYSLGIIITFWKTIFHDLSRKMKFSNFLKINTFFLFALIWFLRWNPISLQFNISSWLLWHVRSNSIANF